MANTINNYIPCVIRETAAGYNTIALADVMLSNRKLNLVGEIDSDNAHSIVQQLLHLQDEDPDAEITMYINSPGGSVNAGLAIYDVMQGISCPVKTVCVGMAASMGALLFTSGTKGRRFMLPNSKLMIHDPLIYETGGSALKLKAVSDDLLKTRSELAKILADNSGKNLKQIYKITENDTFFTAKEAVSFGLADGVAKDLSNVERRNGYEL